MNKLVTILAGAVLVSVAACSQKSEPQQSAKTATPAPTQQPAQQPVQMQQPGAAPAEQPPATTAPQTIMPSGPSTGAPAQMNSAAAPQPGANAGQGKILQSMHASSYTYMEVDMGGKKTWIATNAMAVNNGNTVRWRDGAVMKNFTSNALHRTFDEILFVSYAEIVK